MDIIATIIGELGRDVIGGDADNERGRNQTRKTALRGAVDGYKIEYDVNKENVASTELRSLSGVDEELLRRLKTINVRGAEIRRKRFVATRRRGQLVRTNCVVPAVRVRTQGKLQFDGKMLLKVPELQ
ncbi:hypothetical protein Y032_0517g2813 [Ancylostoma ceylanicum]|uniref:Uncharacterized protein n=1 Tax=Ancylostoma ceylanicum TaxID=53326 RepID=A0A016WT20_9BILA|nr:hypothetical protein Y032_0517g2813 [Ancylostoma ceylanicum]